MYKNHLLKGALLLTAAGVFSRIIGFFYRIFLSRTFGAEQMGIYELISPVLALSFALCTSAIQSSISKFTAAEPEAAIYAKRRILLTGLSVSFVLSCLCTLFVWREADFISDFLLNALCAAFKNRRPLLSRRLYPFVYQRLLLRHPKILSSGVLSGF